MFMPSLYSIYIYHSAKTDGTSYESALDESNRLEGSRRGGGGGLDDSISNRLTMNIGQLFGRRSSNNDNGSSNLNNQEKDSASYNPKVNRGYTIKHSRHEDIEVSAGDKGKNNSQRQRRPPSKARQSRQHKQSSRSFLESNGVVFPSSFEDVVEKGCGDLKNSLKRSANDLTVESWEMKCIMDETDGRNVEW